METHFINETNSLALKLIENKLLKGLQNVKGGVQVEEKPCERQEGENNMLEITSMKDPKEYVENEKYKEKDVVIGSDKRDGGSCD